MARRYSAAAWAPLLAAPARHGWVPRDLNQLVSDWSGVHRWVPDDPYKPIGLLGAMLAWHGDLQDRPAAADMAREAAELVTHRARVADQLAELDRAAAARAAGRAALDGAGHAAARAAAAGSCAPVRASTHPHRRGGHGAPGCGSSAPPEALTTSPDATTKPHVISVRL